MSPQFRLGLQMDYDLDVAGSAPARGRREGLGALVRMIMIVQEETLNYDALSGRGFGP